MQKVFHRYLLPVSIIVFLFAGVLFASQVLAKGKPENPGENGALNREEHQQNPETLKPEAENESEGSSASGELERGKGTSHIPDFAKVHLQDTKLRACEAISASVVRRSGHLVDLVAKMEQNFTAIAEGVEQYYLTKVVPTGASLPNYDALVADIATKQAAVDSMVVTAQDDAANFSCTGNNPGAQLTQYRTDMQAVIRGLQDFRTAIKNLIVAVRTLHSISVSTTPIVTPSVTLVPTDTPTPTETPTVTP